MTSVKDKHDPEGVTAYIEKLGPGQAALVEKVRRAILDADGRIGEQLKWNAPAFFYTGEMQDFDPKTYKRDIVVMNLRQKGHLLLIFPTGDVLQHALLEGDHADGRRMLKINNEADLDEKKEALQEILCAWIAESIEKS